IEGLVGEDNLTAALVLAEPAVVGVRNAEQARLRVESDLEVVEEAAVRTARPDSAEDALQADAALVVRQLRQLLLGDVRVRAVGTADQRHVRSPGDARR